MYAVNVMSYTRVIQLPSYYNRKRNLGSVSFSFSTYLVYNLQ